MFVVGCNLFVVVLVVDFENFGIWIVDIFGVVVVVFGIKFGFVE